MDKLRVGVIVHFDDEPTDGGKYTYFNTLLKGINNFTFDPQIEIVNIVFYKDKLPKYQFKKQSIFIKEGFGNRIKLLARKLTKKSNSTTFTKRNPVINLLYSLSLKRKNTSTEALLKKNKIDMVYYLKQQEDIINYPFIATIWDVSHKSTNGFPEHTMNYNYEFREKYYLYTLNKAFVILCESQTGVQELKNFYSFYDKKIKVLPFFPGNIIEQEVDENQQKHILSKYNLEKDNFFVYPAQFWPHKNHYNLILAFSKLVRNNHSQIKLVLCGSNKGNLDYIMELIHSLSLASRVVITGFVSEDELLTFYKNAVALTMPTFLGPTNLPVIEAAALKCAVLCSDFEGHRELLGDNALYFDPGDASVIAEAMTKILDPTFREPMVQKAYDYTTRSPFNLNNSLRTLNEILLETKSKRKSWGVDYSL